MSYNEAKEDGVRIEERPFFTAYFPLCVECGEEVRSMSYIRGLKYKCKKCRELDAISDKAARADRNEEDKEKKFSRAVERIKGMVEYDRKYRAAEEAVHKKLHKVGWFDSTEEIMTAIELTRRGIPARHQVKFGRFRVDFVLPTEKVVLEIDGDIFHSAKIDRDKMRDELIVAALGYEWEVIRVGTDRINENISQLVKAIRIVKAQRKRCRQENGGVLPGWYSNKAI